MIYSALQSQHAMTDRQLMEYFGFSDRNSISPRVNEMVRSGVLFECGTAQDHVTGKRVRIVAIRRKPKQEELFQ